nr:immunoglobulin light chain junction region [Macaca mulatta]
CQRYGNWPQLTF